MNEYIEQIQDTHCDMTRTTEKKFRVLRNIGMAAPYFPENESVLCFGSGDGFEIEIWRRLGFRAVGCEISKVKREIARSHGLYSWADRTEVLGNHNIYCAHTIEHVTDVEDTLGWFVKTCVSTLCLIFPIEPYGSKNPSHLSPIKSMEQLRIPRMEVVLKFEHWNDEREGVLIYQQRS